MDFLLCVYSHIKWPIKLWCNTTKYDNYILIFKSPKPWRLLAFTLKILNRAMPSKWYCFVYKVFRRFGVFLKVKVESNEETLLLCKKSVLPWTFQNRERKSNIFLL